MKGVVTRPIALFDGEVYYDYKIESVSMLAFVSVAQLSTYAGALKLETFDLLPGNWSQC